MDRSRQLGVMIWGLTVAIIVMGLAAVYSATYQNARVSHDLFYDQLVMAAGTLAIVFVMSRLHHRRFYEIAYVVYGVSVAALVLVLVMGRTALGAQRWLTLGPISFQPSELAKWGLILALARYFADQRLSLRQGGWMSASVRFWHQVGVPLGMTLAPMILTYKQPDLGTTLLFFGIFMIMLFHSGLSLRVYGGLCAVVTAALPFGWHFLKDYQKERLLVFMNPNIDPLGAGYTVIQSRISLGSGQLFGKGWLAGTQNQLNFLPERHTDFIFSVIGEEWGFAGTFLLLGCYVGLFYACLKAGEEVKDPFGLLLAVGCAGLLAMQAIINMAMVMGFCPVVGLTLPFVSYGRTSFFVFSLMIGSVLSLTRRRTIF